MPEIPDSLNPKESGHQPDEPVVRWRTVSYRALGIWSGGVLVLLVVGGCPIHS